MSLKALKNMSCFVLNSGFYFHLPFVVQLPVLHVLLLHRLGRWQGKKKAFLSHTQLTKRNMPCKNWSPFSGCHLHIPPGKKTGGRREKEQYLVHREDITKPQPHESHGGTFQTRIEVQGDVFIHTPSSSDSRNYAQAHTVQIIHAPSRNNLHPREREEIFVSPWAQLLD